MRKIISGGSSRDLPTNETGSQMRPKQTTSPETNKTEEPAGCLRRAILVLAAVASASLLVVGCGGASSAPGPSASRFTAAAFKYASCMRHHGVPSFPDPSTTDHNGQKVGYFATPDSLRASPAFKSANEICQGLLTPQLNTAPSASDSTRKQHLLAFAQCMRSHRVTDFPDPTAQGQLTQQMVAKAGIDLHAPAVIAAAKACLPTAGGAVTAQQVEQAIHAGQ